MQVHPCNHTWLKGLRVLVAFSWTVEILLTEIHWLWFCWLVPREIVAHWQLSSTPDSSDWPHLARRKLASYTFDKTSDCAGCPISYLVSASDVLSNVQVLSNSPISFVQDVVSFRTVWCTTQLPVGNYFTLTFSEQVVINRIRVSGFQSAYISDFSLLVQENATSTLNPFNQVWLHGCTCIDYLFWCTYKEKCGYFVWL